MSRGIATAAAPRSLCGDLDMASYVSPVPRPPRPALPTDDAVATAPAEPASAQLPYEMVLQPGEIAEASIPPDTLVVRMGMPTRLRYLFSRWPTLLWIAILDAVTLYWAVKLEPAVTRQPVNPRDRLAVFLPATTLFVMIFTFGKLTLQAPRPPRNDPPHRLPARPHLPQRPLPQRPRLGRPEQRPRPPGAALSRRRARRPPHALSPHPRSPPSPIDHTPTRSVSNPSCARIAQTMGIDPVPTTLPDPP